jgi:hypothetical protein
MSRVSQSVGDILESVRVLEVLEDVGAIRQEL